MSKKRKSTTQNDKDSPVPRVPRPDLEARLQVVWQSVGHLIDWCDSSEAWMQVFCVEARPYRETFYWEAVARMMSEYLTQHPTDSAEDALTDGLIATQRPPSSDDHEALTKFHNMWQQLLIASQREIDTSMQRGLGVGPAGWRDLQGRPIQEIRE
jgi:hypothetical protein